MLQNGKEVIHIENLLYKMCVLNNGMIQRLHDEDFNTRTIEEKLIHQLSVFHDALEGTIIGKNNLVTVVIEARKTSKLRSGILAGALGLLVAEGIDSHRRDQLKKAIEAGVFIDENYSKQLLSLIDQYGWKLRVS